MVRHEALERLARVLAALIGVGCSTVSDLPLRQIAVMGASVTSWAVMLAMTNGRCRFHGGLSTGPRTAESLKRMRAAKTVHGGRSQEMRELRELIRSLKADARRLVEIV